MNIFALLDRSGRRYPDRGAIYNGGQCVFTYGEWRTRALRLATTLVARGQAGDRVAIAAKNCTEYPVVLFAIWAAGMVAVPMNAKLHAREMGEVVEDCGARLVFVSSDTGPTLAGHAGLSASLVDMESVEYRTMLNGDVGEPVAVSSDALAWLFFTSGTTGRPKGAMLSHRNLMAMSLSHLADFEQVNDGDSILHGAPMSHGSGLYILPYAGRGARQVVPASHGFDATEFLDLIDQHPGCGMFLAPTMVRRLRLEAEKQGRRPANLRSIIYGGGPMYSTEIVEAIAVLGPVFRQLYGQGESPMTITGLTLADHLNADAHVLRSVGWARSGVEVAVVDADDRPLPPGEIGEIVCRGDVVMQGYWNLPSATADTLRNGWLHTGDMGVLDETGMLTLHDRSKDVIISGGSNIYPREVEEVLLTHPAVAEACVVGQQDIDWGEIVIAFIVAEPGMVIDAASLDAFCLERIARFKRPKTYRFISALPKNSYGKVPKRELLQALAAKNAG
jgi:acyl-CoA synthetase (AMP-forming)/AMP-acid ligase II